MMMIIMITVMMMMMMTGAGGNHGYDAEVHNRSITSGPAGYPSTQVFYEWRGVLAGVGALNCYLTLGLMRGKKEDRQSPKRGAYC
jgi:hypothetical protein